ncbi:MAG: hypothetical protein MJB14_03485 [Spirochaetes bacterium]|nr:hypothetical protein [Spirochaetota bacterium]
MSDRLDFSLPQKKEKKKIFTPANILLMVLIVLVSITLGLTIFNRIDLKNGQQNLTLDPLKQEELALRLQKNHLYLQAARAWENYLQQKKTGKEKTANIYYTIGKLYKQAGYYEKAIAAFYQSELTYAHKNLTDEISLHIQESYENLGNFAGLRNELNERVGLAENPDNAVIAEIGQDKITASDLDKKIENFIDLQLSQLASYMPEEELTRQKEQLFKQYSGQDHRFNMLNQYIVEELLYRQSLEQNIAKETKVNDLANQMKRSLYAQTYLNQQLASKINITEGDLKNYYQANQGKFIKDHQPLSFNEAQKEVYAALRREKEEELKNELLQKLKNQYNVVIHSSKLNKTDENTGN